MKVGRTIAQSDGANFYRHAASTLVIRILERGTLYVALYMCTLFSTVEPVRMRFGV